MLKVPVDKSLRILLIVRMGRFVGVVCATTLCLLGPSVGEGATLAGQTIRPGATLDIRFPVSKFFQDYAAAGGHCRQEHGSTVDRR